MKKKARSADFCVGQIGVITTFDVITNAVIKMVHCITMGTGIGGRAIVLGYLLVPERHVILIREGPAMLAKGARWMLFEHFTFVYPIFAFHSPAFWETTSYRLKHCQ